MSKTIAEEILFEIEEIEELFVTYGDLLSRVQERTPDVVEVAALASVLHSFYMGLENIFLVIAKRLDAGVPSGSRWHSDLLAQMTQSTARRGQVISMDLRKTLSDYASFRHVARHAYTTRLNWDEMAEGVMQMSRVWAQAKSELLAFVETLSKE